MGNVVMNNEFSKGEEIQKDKKPRGEVVVSASEKERIEILESWRKGIEGNINDIQTEIERNKIEIKTEIAAFIFQTISIIIALFGVVGAIIFGVTTQWNVNNDMKAVLLIILIGYVGFILTCCLLLWHKIHFKVKENQQR